MKTAKRALSLLLSLLLVLGAVAVGGMSASADGDGIVFNSADNRYEISNYAGLKEFASIVNGTHATIAQNQAACAILTQDFTATDTDWTPIGNGSGSDDSQIRYNGTFDGMRHIITGLTTPEGYEDYAGLFGCVGIGGKVMNVGLEGGSITGQKYVGGVAGRSYGTVTGCNNTGVVSGAYYVGGVVGYSYDNSSVENCYNTGDVSGIDYVGGVVGYNSENSSVKNCYNTGSVTATEQFGYVGGVLGYNSYYSSIENCYNMGSVTATGVYACVGGVVGCNYGSGTILNCYNTGSVKATAEKARTGGVAGRNYENSSIENCYNTGAVSGALYVGGVVGLNEESSVVNCFYDSDRVSGAPAIGHTNDETGINAEGLTTADMTGTNAIGTADKQMNFSDTSVWLVRADDEFYSYYPHLSGFDLDAGGNQIPTENIRKADWPARLLKDGVCEISDYAELKAFASRVNNRETGLCAVLTANIDASASDPEKNPNYNADTDAWTPIGNNYFYVGTFDGDGHIITGLSTPEGFDGYGGLIGFLESGGTVQNVGLEGGKLNGTDYYVGGVVGHNKGTVQNCYNTGSIIGNNTYTGGVVGHNEGGTVQKCYNTGSVESNSTYTGGVVGYNDGTVQNCYNTGSVKGSRLYTGGVTGYNEGGTVQNCCNAGSVESNNSFTGGVVGKFEDGEAQNCFNTGNVSGNGYVGGVAGFLQYGTVSDCYNTGRVTSSDTYVGGVAGLIEDCTVSDCYNTGRVKGNGRFVGGVAGLESGEVENCYYDKSICNVDNDIGTGLTTDNMTGANALNNMSGFSSAAWLTKANTDDIKFYPHLKGFNLDNSGSQLSAENIQPEDWPAKYVIYPLWVGGNQVTTGNMGALEDLDGVTVAEGGSVTFEPNKDGTGGTLYLNNATITGTYEEEVGSTYNANIFATGDGFDLTICLEGENTVNGSDAEEGILVKYDNGSVLTITGEGTLDVTGTSFDIVCYELSIENTTVTATGKPDSYAVYSTETSISGSTVKATGKEMGLFCDASLKIKDSIVEATGDNVGIFITSAGSNGGLTVSGESTVTANGYYYIGGLLSYGGFTFEDGNEIIIPEKFTFKEDEGVAYGLLIEDGKSAETVVIGQPCAVTFNNDDGTELQSGVIPKGTAPEYNGETPTKTDPTGQYTYTFSGWKDSAGNTYGTKPEFPKADVATIYTATFTNTVNEYTIKFANEDGTELQSGKVLYGETPEYKGNTPTKAATAEYTYTFAGWTPEIASVTGDATYTATYTATPVDYTLTFCVDGKVYKESTVPFGSEVKAPEAETKEGYTFTWVDDIPATMPAKDITINGKYTPIEYTATFTADGKTVKEEKFTVETEKLDEPAVPAKEGYTGKWSEYTLAAADITITSEYTANEYTITYVVDGKKTEVKYAFGAAVSKPANPSKEGFTFDGWDKDIPATMPAENLTITALFSPVPSTEVSEIEFTDSAEMLEQTRLYGMDNGFSVKGDIPKGAKVEWYVNGEKAGEGRNFIVTEPKEDYTVQAKLVDADGNVLSETDEANIDINTGFFARLYWFFCSFIQRIIDLFKGTAA